MEAPLVMFESWTGNNLKSPTIHKLINFGGVSVVLLGWGPNQNELPDKLST